VRFDLPAISGYIYHGDQISIAAIQLFTCRTKVGVVGEEDLDTISPNIFLWIDISSHFTYNINN
jgi:hypothetical protein